MDADLDASNWTCACSKLSAEPGGDCAARAGRSELPSLGEVRISVNPARAGSTAADLPAGQLGGVASGVPPRQKAAPIEVRELPTREDLTVPMAELPWTQEPVGRHVVEPCGVVEQLEHFNGLPQR